MVKVIPLLFGSVASLDTGLYSTFGNESTDLAIDEPKVLLVTGKLFVERDNSLKEISIEYPAEEDTCLWRGILFEIVDELVCQR